MIVIYILLKFGPLTYGQFLFFISLYFKPTCVLLECRYCFLVIHELQNIVADFFFELFELDRFLIKQHGLFTQRSLCFSKALFKFLYDGVEGIRRSDLNLLRLHLRRKGLKFYFLIFQLHLQITKLSLKIKIFTFKCANFLTFCLELV